MSSNFNCLQTKLTHSRKLVGAIGLRPPVGSLVAKCEEKRSMNYDIANIMPANHSENETRCLCQDQRAKIYFDKLDASNNRAERRLGTDRWNPSLDRIGTPVLSFFARLASSGAAVVRCFALLFAFLLLPILSAEAQRATEINLDVQKIIVQGSDTTVGGTVTYQIIVHNSNFDGDVLDATNVVLKDSLPAGIKFDSVTGGTWDDRTGELHISTLTAGEAKTLIIETTIEAGTEGQTICNTALVKSADQTDKDSTYGETKLGEDDEAEVVARPEESAMAFSCATAAATTRSGEADDEDEATGMPLNPAGGGATAWVTGDARAMAVEEEDDEEATALLDGSPGTYSTTSTVGCAAKRALLATR